MENNCYECEHVELEMTNVSHNEGFYWCGDDKEQRAVNIFKPIPDWCPLKLWTPPKNVGQIYRGVGTKGGG